MTLKIDRHDVGSRVILHLVGNVHVEHLDELKAQIGATDCKVVLDVGGVTLISVEGIRFLNSCSLTGISIENASPYISKWMTLERKFTRKRKKACL